MNLTQARDRFGNKRDETDGLFESKFYVDTLLDPWRGDPPPKSVNNGIPDSFIISFIISFV